MKVVFITGCVTISRISLFAFQRLVKAHAENYHIAVLCRDDSFGDSVLVPGQTFHFIFIQMAALGIEHTHILSHLILDAFQNRNISGRGSVVVSDQGSTAVCVGSDDTDGLQFGFVKRQNTVVL